VLFLAILVGLVLRTKSTRKPTMGTVKKSMETRSRRCAPLREQPGDRTLGHLDSQLLQFTVDSRRAPERIDLSHSSDESPDLAAYARASRRGASGESGPVLAEAAALPP